MPVREATMDVQLVPKTVLPSGPQASPQPPPANGAEANSANKPILANAAQAVTVGALTHRPAQSSQVPELRSLPCATTA